MLQHCKSITTIISKLDNENIQRRPAKTDFLRASRHVNPYIVNERRIESRLKSCEGWRSWRICLSIRSRRPPAYFWQGHERFYFSIMPAVNCLKRLPLRCFSKHFHTSSWKQNGFMVTTPIFYCNAGGHSIHLPAPNPSTTIRFSMISLMFKKLTEQSDCFYAFSSTHWPSLHCSVGWCSLPIVCK